MRLENKTFSMHTVSYVIIEIVHVRSENNNSTSLDNYLTHLYNSSERIQEQNIKG